jgi:hypothetical protein
MVHNPDYWCSECDSHIWLLTACVWLYPNPSACECDERWREAGWPYLRIWTVAPRVKHPWTPVSLLDCRVRVRPPHHPFIVPDISHRTSGQRRSHPSQQHGSICNLLHTSGLGSLLLTSLDYDITLPACSSLTCSLIHWRSQGGMPPTPPSQQKKNYVIYNLIIYIRKI